MSATATDFSTTASTAGSTEIQLQGSVSSGTISYVCAASSGSYTAPSHGLLSDFNAATGIVVYTPNSGFTGTDTLQFAVVQDGTTTSTAATCTITVTSAKTTIQDYLLNPDGSSRGGVITAFLTQPAISSAGLVPASASVSATVNESTGAFTLSLYPSRSLSPQAYYQIWWGETNNLRKELVGVFDIPASASTILLWPYQVTDANLAARYTFVSLAGHRAAVAADEAIQVLNNGTAVATRPAINFIPGSNISYTIADNSGSNRVDVTISGPAGGGTGGSVNSGAAGKLAYYASTGTTVGGLAFGTANQVLGMNSGATAYEHKTVTAGSGISVTHGTNAITIANTGVNSINSDTTAAHSIRIGTTGSAPAVTTSGGITTVSIPAASTTAGGYITVGTQTIAGAKTITGDDNADTPLTVKQKASGSDYLQYWSNSSGTAYGSFNVASTTAGLWANKLAAGNSISAPTSGYALYVANAETSDGKSGALINASVTANSTTGNLRGLFVTYTLDGTGTHTASAGRSAAIDAGFTFTGSGTLTSVSGVRGSLTNDDTGTITAGRVFYSTADLSGGATITALSHYYAAAPTISASTLTTQYGFYSESLTGASTNWAFYSAGTTGSSLGGFLDLRGRSAPSVSNSQEVRLYADTSGNLKISGNGGAYGTVPVFLSGSASLDFSSISAQSSATLTITVTGATAGKPVFLGIPTAAVNSGIVYTAYVSASDTVTVVAYNITSGSINPSAGTFTAYVIQ